MKAQVRVSATKVSSSAKSKVSSSSAIPKVSSSSAKKIVPNSRFTNITLWLKKITTWLRNLLSITSNTNKSSGLKILASWESRDQSRKLYKIERNTPGAVATYQLKFEYLPEIIQIGIDELGELRRSSLKRQLELGESYKKQEADIGLFESKEHRTTHRLWIQHVWKSSSTNKVYQRMRWILDFDAQQRERYEKSEAIAQYVALYLLNTYYPPKRNPIAYALQEDLMQVLYKACQKEIGERYLHNIEKYLPRDEKKVKPVTRLAS